MTRRTSEQTRIAVTESKAKRKRTPRKRRLSPRRTELKAIHSINAAEHLKDEHEAMTWQLRDMAYSIDTIEARLESSMFGDPATEKSLAWHRDLYVRFLSSLLLTPKAQAEADQIDDLDTDPLEQLQAKIVDIADRR